MYFKRNFYDFKYVKFIKKHFLFWHKLFSFFSSLRVGERIMKTGHFSSKLRENTFENYVVMCPKCNSCFFKLSFLEIHFCVLKCFDLSLPSG